MGEKMKKVLFGITSLTLGGAERVLVDLANRLANEYEITIFTIYPDGEFEKMLSPKIKKKSLCKKPYSELSKWQQKIGMPLKVLLLQNHLYHKYIREDFDVEIAFLEGPITRLFSTKNKKTRKIAWIHNDVSLVFGKGVKAKLKQYIDRKIYSKFETLVFVSQDNRKSFDTIYKDIRDKELVPIHKRVIYNYIDQENILQKAQIEENVPFKKEVINFLTVARLVEQKGIDRLIKVHKKLIEEKLYHQFYVIGEGPLQEKLQQQITEAKVEDTFMLLGKKENPYPYMKQTDYFCLLSHFEGYGMVLEEAKILKKPIVITDTAAREAVINYENSQIVENTEQGIYEALKEIIKQGKDNIGFAKQEQVPYDNSKIMKKIKDLIGE